MNILVRHAPPFRRWHLRLGERLEAAGHAVRFEAAGRPAGRAVLAIERRLYGVVPDWDASELPPHPPGWSRELTIVLAGSPPASGKVVRPDIDEAGLLAAARAGTAPCIAILGGTNGAMRPLARGRPAMEDHLVLARALEDLLPRLVTLLVQAVSRLEASESAVSLDEDGPKQATSAVAHAARGVRHKLSRRLGPARGRPNHWRIALRRYDDADWTKLSDDPTRFRADPFLFEDAGRSWLFYEEYPYASGKGVIGCLAVASIGSPSRCEEGLGMGVGQRNPAPEERSPIAHFSIIDASPTPTPDFFAQGGGEARVIIEEDFHLSYPLVLRHRGQIYMLPEMSAATRVQLYRADPFPDRWTPDAVLIEGSRLGDATPILHEGRWWLFATSNDDGGSSWDQLHLFHAPDLFGPWTPHDANPVLIDAGAARPAGRMWHENGVLMRPAQDCRTGYGAGVAICRVDRLDDHGYRQSVVRRIRPPEGSDANGLHTLNREAGWEVVDWKVPHPKGPP